MTHVSGNMSQTLESLEAAFCRGVSVSTLLAGDATLGRPRGWRVAPSYAPLLS